MSQSTFSRRSFFGLGAGVVGVVSTGGSVFAQAKTKPIKVAELMETLDAVLDQSGEDRRGASWSPVPDAGERRVSASKEIDA